MEARREPVVLAGILHVGEPSLTATLGALAQQQGVVVRTVQFGGFPEREAHRWLYHTFSEAGPEIDLLAKVDADMVILHPGLFRSAHRFMVEHPGIDRVTFGVQDWLSGHTIVGLHTWRPDVRWTAQPPDLHTDLAPNTVRRSIVLKNPSSPLVLHAPEPTRLQAARYAARRTLKARASDNDAFAWSTIERLVRTAIDGPIGPRRIAVAAVRLALDDPIEAKAFVMANGSTDDVLRRLDDAVENWPGLAIDVLRVLEDLQLRADLSTAPLLRRPPSRWTPVSALPLRVIRGVTWRIRSRSAWSAGTVTPDVVLIDRLVALLGEDQPDGSEPVGVTETQEAYGSRRADQ